MAYNRELSQFASQLSVDDTTKKIGIATDVSVSGVVTATEFRGSGRFLTDVIATKAGDPTALDKQIFFNDDTNIKGAADFYYDKATNNVGLGTSTPSSKLVIVGDVVATNFIGNLNSATGITTLGITTVQQLSVTGVTTLGNTSVQQLSVTGVTTLGITSIQQLNVSGVSTFSSSLFGTDVTLSGVITASSFNGQVGTFTTINGSSLYYNSGIITSLTSTDASLTNINSTGITTLGVTTVTDLNIQNLSVSGVSTFTNGPILIGSGTSTGTATQRLQITGDAYVSGNLGIGTTNPSTTLEVVGNANVTGIVSATKFIQDGIELKNRSIGLLFTLGQ